MMTRTQSPMCRPTTSVGSYRPSVNILNQEDGTLLQFAVPGFRKEDISIHVDEKLLHIEGRLSEADAEKRFARREFQLQPFKVTYRLGDRVNQEAIQAQVEDGILSITLGMNQPIRHEIAVV